MMLKSNGKTEVAADIHPKRLFGASCVSLIATSVTFAIVGAIMGPLKEAFVLTNEQIGWIGGAGLWGFTLTIFIFGPLCDVLGMKLLLRLAFLGHAAGVMIMIFATGYEMLFIGSLTLAMANGIVEAVCNPLVATIYPDKKTEMLNKFHVWFPGGIVIGGLVAYALDKIAASTEITAIGSWQLKLVAILIPTVIYGGMILGQKFPATERVQSGISFGQMFKGTMFRPLFLLLLLCMIMTASLELGPNRWVPAVLQAAGIPGILVLVWINLLMAILRYYAGSVVHRISPTTILLFSATIGGLGLWWLSYTATLAAALAAGTIFAIGVCYFWPTMLGITSERVPRGGALALALMGGMGAGIVGLVTSPMMGRVADNHIVEVLPVQETTQCLKQVIETFPVFAEQSEAKSGEDINTAIQLARDVLAMQATERTLPGIETANALRSAIAAAPKSPVAEEARKLLGPAENHGGKIAFRQVSFLAVVLVVIFGALSLYDRAKGGYKAEYITSN